jgi:low temperature requirement protein LtrA
MRGLRLKQTMMARDTGEEHRAATALELFFDLCFVVAVAQAVSGLHHFAAEGDFARGLLRYALAFFIIWWPWVNFTWFASAFDTDDAAYRVAVFIQIAGALTIAAGIPRLFADLDASVTVTGYIIMRLGLVELWLRAARGDPEMRTTGNRFAVGVATIQVLWLLWLFVPDGIRWSLFALFLVVELLIPYWAERAGHTRWHPGHIAERYGLFTIIVLGESVLAASISVQSALDAGEPKGRLLAIAAGGLLIVAAMWWLYFDAPTDGVLRRFWADGGRAMAGPFIFGYGHIVFFASAAAVGAGLEIAVDLVTHHTEISARQAAAMIAVPVAVYVGAIWAMRLLLDQCPKEKAALYAAVIALTLATILLTDPVLPIGLVMAGLIAGLVVLRFRHESRLATGTTP